MKGCRPLSTQEIIAVSEQFTGAYEVRNRALFILGCTTGGRVSELLALKIDDVWQNGKPIGDLLYERAIVKGGEVSRMIPVNADGQKVIDDLIGWHKEQFGSIDPHRPLFPSRKGDQAITRTQAHRVLKNAYQKAGLNGKLATHSMRKTYAQRTYDASGDIFLVKECLGHKSVETTQKYLGVSYEKMQKTAKAIELNRTPITLHSIDGFSEGDLLLELQKRGLDVSQLIDQLKTEHLHGAKFIPMQSQRVKPEKHHGAKIIPMRKVA